MKAPLIKPVHLFTERVRPYASASDWFAGIWQKWKIILAAGFTNLVATNGLEATFRSCPVRWIAEAFAGAGITWTAAVLQTLFHAIYSGASHIAQGTQHPFPKRR